jgi:cystathionine beta-lyase family protein involved in aluminum resistance
MIGIQGGAAGSLKELGIIYRQVDLLPDGNLNWDEIKKALNKKTRLVLLQRSRGYRWASPLKLAQIKEVTKFIKERFPEVIIFIDNCYGEFVDKTEPTAIGVDLAAGSLLKNPGGGLAPTGGYVVG